MQGMKQLTSCMHACLLEEKENEIEAAVVSVNKIVSLV